MAGLVDTLLTIVTGFAVVWIIVTFVMLYRLTRPHKEMQRNIVMIAVTVNTGALASLFFNLYHYYIAFAVCVMITVTAVVWWDMRKFNKRKIT